MSILGVNAESTKLWLCCVDSTGPQETDPVVVMLRDGEVAGYDIESFRKECTHALTAISPELVVILDAEPRGRATVAQLRSRFVAETILSLAALDAGIDCHRASRASVRAKLGLPKDGSFAERTAELFPNKVGPYWKGKRNIAAAAAQSRIGG